MIVHLKPHKLEPGLIRLGLVQGHCTHCFGRCLAAVPQKSQTQIQKIGPLLGFLAQDDMAFFHAQHVLGFNPKILDIKCLAGLLEHEPDSRHIRRRQVQFIGKLAHKPQAHGPGRNRVLDGEFSIFQKPEGLVGQVNLHDLFKHFSGIGSGQVDHAQGIGEVDQGKIPVIIPGVVPDPFNGLTCPAGGGGEIIIILCQFDHNPVINHAAVIIAHGRIFDPALLYL